MSNIPPKQQFPVTSTDGIKLEEARLRILLNPDGSYQGYNSTAVRQELFDFIRTLNPFWFSILTPFYKNAIMRQTLARMIPIFNGEFWFNIGLDNSYIDDAEKQLKALQSNGPSYDSLRYLLIKKMNIVDRGWLSLPFKNAIGYFQNKNNSFDTYMSLLKNYPEASGTKGLYSRSYPAVAKSTYNQLSKIFDWSQILPVTVYGQPQDLRVPFQGVVQPGVRYLTMPFADAVALLYDIYVTEQTLAANLPGSDTVSDPNYRQIRYDLVRNINKQVFNLYLTPFYANAVTYKGKVLNVPDGQGLFDYNLGLPNSRVRDIDVSLVRAKGIGGGSMQYDFLSYQVMITLGQYDKGFLSLPYKNALMYDPYSVPPNITSDQFLNALHKQKNYPTAGIYNNFYPNVSYDPDRVSKIIDWNKVPADYYKAVTDLYAVNHPSYGTLATIGGALLLGVFAYVVYKKRKEKNSLVVQA